MKIKSISCTQFAGIRDRSLSFDDGINLIYGKNESGKSTLVNLLSRTLFQNARIHKKNDKEFVDLYFPSALKGNKVTGDFADGKITIETQDGIYTLMKEWGGDARCILSTPDGVIRDQEKIDTILKGVLHYGEGVYSEMLFSSQHNMNISLQTILDASKKTDAKREITNAVSQAFSESDGIAIDSIEQAINEKIEKIAGKPGKRWDIDRCMPISKNQPGRWGNGICEILKAYYDLEDAKVVLETIAQLEKDADIAAKDYAAKDNEVQRAKEAYNNFISFEEQIELCESIKRYEKEYNKMEKVLSNWPKLKANIEEANMLKTEKDNRKCLDRFNSAKKLNGEIEDLQREINSTDCPTDSEISDVKEVQREITKLENKLCNMNLSATIKMFGGNSVSITSLRTGQIIDVTDNSVSITEAVKISVPGVMEMQFGPADVNVFEIESDIAKKKKFMSSIFTHYGVESLDALEHLKKKISDSKAKKDTLSEKLSTFLGADKYEELEATVSTISGEVRSEESIDRDIFNICNSNDIDEDIREICMSSEIEQYIASMRVIVGGYEKDYVSVASLEKELTTMESKLKNARESVEEMQHIPAEYANIPDPKGYLTELEKNLEFKRKALEDALTRKTATVSKVESYKENLSGDPIYNAETAERIFAETKALLDHWLHIQDVFLQQKQNIQNNPMQDISDSFSKYLGMISDGKISSEFPDHEKLNMNIYSGNYLMDYSKLSEGTKETVSLAFRLAVLDHLFPDGGGVIVFDDPFTDMDADRTVQSCELIKECAKRHQVIFLTCKEEYIDMLGGNKIRI